MAHGKPAMYEVAHMCPVFQVWRSNENKTGIYSISNITLKAKNIATVIWPDSKPSRLTKIEAPYHTRYDLWERG
jgi:hypothetical protein